MAEANEPAAAQEIVLAQLTRTIERRLHRGDLVDLADSPELLRAARAAAEAVLDLAVLLPPGWSLEWSKDPQERIPVAQAEPVAYPTPIEEPYDVNVRRAAEILGVHENTVRNWAKSGRLPSWEMPGSGFHRFQRSVLEAIRKAMDEAPSYHDLHITTDTIPRTSIFDLPYGIEVTCTRVGGWQVRDHSQMVPPPARLPNLPPDPKLLGGEYNAEPEDNEEGRPVTGGLRLDVAGFVVVDSLGKTEDGRG